MSLKNNFSEKVAINEKKCAHLTAVPAREMHAVQFAKIRLKVKKRFVQRAQLCTNNMINNRSSQEVSWFHHVH